MKNDSVNKEEGSERSVEEILMRPTNAMSSLSMSSNVILTFEQRKSSEVTNLTELQNDDSASQRTEMDIMKIRELSGFSNTNTSNKQLVQAQKIVRSSLNLPIDRIAEYKDLAVVDDKFGIRRKASSISIQQDNNFKQHALKYALKSCYTPYRYKIIAPVGLINSIADISDRVLIL